MSYRQYTQCVQPQDFTGAPFGEAVAVGLFAGLTALVTAMLASGGISGLMGGCAAGIAIVSGLLSFANWWLYGRLICLGGDQCTIGMVLSVEPPSSKSIFFERLDTDYSINLLLAPMVPVAGTTISQNDVINNAIDGNLIKETPEVSALAVSFTGEHANACDTSACGGASCPDCASLHCEFEGAGMYIFYQWLKVILGILIAGTVASALCLIPVIGWIACLIAAIALIISGAALLAGLAHAESDAASPADVNPALGGDLHQSDCSLRGADLLVVFGTWVYDSLHSGWNEIHPIKQCQKIGTWNGTWTFPSGRSPQDERDFWCSGIGQATAPITIQNQQNPENQWTIHPVIDGCTPDVIQ